MKTVKFQEIMLSSTTDAHHDVAEEIYNRYIKVLKNFEESLTVSERVVFAEIRKAATKATILNNKDSKER